MQDGHELESQKMLEQYEQQRALLEKPFGERRRIMAAQAHDPEIIAYGEEPCQGQAPEAFSFSPHEADPQRADKLAFYLLKALNKANRDYRLLADDDTILVAVSGGKDSLTLLDLLRRRQRTGRERYRLVAAHVRTDFHCGRAVSPDWLEAWCAVRQIPFVVEDIQVADELATTDLSKCFRCAWNRRRALFNLADRLGCNKLAFAHHADDVAETTLMNLFYNARVHRLEPKVGLFGGTLTVIRPLVYIEERDIVPFVRASGFPIEGQPCPEGEHSRRALMKRLLRQIENECHDVKRHIFRAVERQEQALRRAGLMPEEEA